MEKINISLNQRLEKMPLSSQDKQALLTFAGHFPKLPTHGATEEDLMQLESSLMVHLPVSIKQLLRVIYKFENDQLAWINFSGSGIQVPLSVNLKDVWYQFGIRTGVSSEFERVYVNEKPFLIVSLWMETLQSILAIKINDSDGEDLRVYTLDYEDISSSGHINSGALTPIFESYAALFAAINAIELSNDKGSTIFEALPI